MNFFYLLYHPFPLLICFSLIFIVLGFLSPKRGPPSNQKGLVFLLREILNGFPIPRFENPSIAFLFDSWKWLIVFRLGVFSRFHTTHVWGFQFIFSMLCFKIGAYYCCFLTLRSLHPWKSGTFMNSIVNQLSNSLSLFFTDPPSLLPSYHSLSPHLLIRYAFIAYFHYQ